MSQFYCQVIADTIYNGKRITTLALTYPRFIHAQVLTHRAFSRNSSSSRAIPISKVINDVETLKVNPMHWGLNKPGMQASEELNEDQKIQALQIWEEARSNTVKHATKLNELGIHKQVVNRILEPFQHIRTVLTATDFQNFFDLRIDDAAQPEIQMLAKVMYEALKTSTPKESTEHLPYVKDGELTLSKDEKLGISAARCARVSYLNHDGTKSDLTKDLALAKTLRDHRHMSPFEHQATAAEGRHFNLDGWKSYRYDMEYNPSKEV